MAQSEYDALQKLNSMVPDHITGLLKEAKRLLESGAIDLEKFEDDYILPKILMHTALLNEAWQYKLHSKEAQKIVNNLKHF